LSIVSCVPVAAKMRTLIHRLIETASFPFLGEPDKKLKRGFHRSNPTSDDGPVLPSHNCVTLLLSPPRVLPVTSPAPAKFSACEQSAERVLAVYADVLAKTAKKPSCVHPAKCARVPPLRWLATFPSGQSFSPLIRPSPGLGRPLQRPRKPKNHRLFTFDHCVRIFPDGVLLISVSEQLPEFDDFMTTHLTTPATNSQNHPSPHDVGHVSIVPATPRGLQHHPHAVLQEVSPAQDLGSDVNRPQWPAANVH